MAVSIPFLTGETNYRLACPIDDTAYYFDVHWNSRDAAWYFDMYEQDGTIVVLNVKVVNGVPLGRRSLHEFFEDHMIVVVDSSGHGRDAAFDDLNTRVLVVLQSTEDNL